MAHCVLKMDILGGSDWLTKLHAGFNRAYTEELLISVGGLRDMINQTPELEDFISKQYQDWMTALQSMEQTQLHQLLDKPLLCYEANEADAKAAAEAASAQGAAAAQAGIIVQKQRKTGCIAAVPCCSHDRKVFQCGYGL